jgi:hypothetical protein
MCNTQNTVKAGQGAKQVVVSAEGGSIPSLVAIKKHAPLKTQVLVVIQVSK